MAGLIAGMKKDPSSRGALMALGRTGIGSAIIDLTPFLGGIKQINESIDGERTTGEKLSGKKRIIHGLVGAGSLVLDFTGIGEGVELLKVGGKSVGLVKGVASKLAGRGATKSAALFEKSAAFMVKNPELVAAGEKAAQNHIDDAIRYTSKASKSDARKTLKEEASKHLPPEIAGALIDAGEAKLRGSVFPSGGQTSPTSSPLNLESARKAALTARRVQSFAQQAPAVSAQTLFSESSQNQISVSAQKQEAPSDQTQTTESVTKQEIMEKAQSGRVKTFLAARAKGTVMSVVSGGTWFIVKRVGQNKVASAVMDLVPFLGGIKQLSEAVDGKTTTGEKLVGKKRIIHGLVGVVSFGLDFTGVGEVAEVVKGARIAGKSTGFMTRSAGVLSARGATKSAALAEKSAAFMARNPELVKAAENVAEKHLDDGIKYVRTASKSDARKTLKEEASKFMPPAVAEIIVQAGEAKMRGAPIPSISDSARKAALSAARGSKPLQMPAHQQLRIPPTPRARDEEEEEQEAQEQEQAVLYEQALLSHLIQSKRSKETEDDEEEKKTLAQKGKRAAVRYVFKQAMRRGFIFLLDFIAAACDLSSAGISFVIDIFIYAFTLGYLNLEMIYGRWIAKGKSKIISPTSWFPIPMVVDPEAIILQSFIISMDIALGVAVVVMGAGGMCILHDYVTLVSDPVAVGTALASGNVGDMCLGGIMSLVINGI